MISPKERPERILSIHNVPDWLRDAILANETQVFHQVDPETAQKSGSFKARIEFMEQLLADTCLLDHDDFQCIYSSLQGDYHFDSPACSVHVSQLPGCLKRATNPESEYIPVLDMDEIPEKYWKYVLIHEFWEIFVYSRNANNEKRDALTEDEYEALCKQERQLYNIRRWSDRDDRRPLLEQTRPDHCFALQQEMRAAARDSILEEYMGWWETRLAQKIDKANNLSDTEISNMPDFWGPNELKRNTLLKRLHLHLNARRNISKKIGDRMN